MKKINLSIFKTRMKNPNQYRNAILLAVLFLSIPMFASGGGTALVNAAQSIKDYLPGIKALMKAIAAVVAIIGGIRIFNKWQNGDQDTTKEMIGWVGAIIFILLVPTFVEAMLT